MKRKDFLISQKCIKFDAKLVDIVVDNFDEFLAVRAKYTDHVAPKH